MEFERQLIEQREEHYYHYFNSFTIIFCIVSTEKFSSVLFNLVLLTVKIVLNVLEYYYIAVLLHYFNLFTIILYIVSTEEIFS